MALVQEENLSWLFTKLNHYAYIHVFLVFCQLKERLRPVEVVLKLSTSGGMKDL